MATFSKKSKDPTEIALSAIQDALSVRDAEERTTDRAAAHSDGPIRRYIGRFHPPRHAAVTGASRTTCFSNRPPARPAGTRRRAAPPTTTAPVIGQILQALQRRPTRTPYVVAALFAARLGGLRPRRSPTAISARDRAPDRQGSRRAPLLVGLTAGVPRADRLPVRARPHARALAGAAHHRPVDGRSRHPACRAGDRRARVRSSASARRSAARSPRWATASSARWRAPPNSRRMVNNEVNALERAYNDNEVRIRSLLDGLVAAARHAGRPGRAGAQRHHQRASRPVARHLLGQRSGRRARQPGHAAHRPRADREGRAHHARARQRRRFDDRGARRARRRPARAPRAHQPARPPTRSSRPATA